MPQNSGNLKKFWRDLKRRKVIYVITVYAAISFAILQVVDIVARPLQLPDWTEALIIVLLCIGFVISVFVSWIYDLTPAGIRKTKPLGAAKRIDYKTTSTSSGWKTTSFISAVLIIVLLGFNFIHKGELNEDLSKLDKSIAVLPFINDSPNDSNQYFINGIMDKVLNNLQLVKELRVISRTSVEQYRNTTKSVPEIAKELGVNYIVEGSGQRYGNSFSVSVQLIRAKGKETHIWAKPYEQEIREVKDILDIQSQIAQSIAAELKASITPVEKQIIEKIPTANLTAYDFYQRGREEVMRTGPSALNHQKAKRAETFFKKSLGYDSTFAPGYTGLAMVSYLKGNLDSMLIFANIALSHDYQLADAYSLRGVYFADRYNYEKAAEEFDKAIKFNPNDWRAYYLKGFLRSSLVRSIENFQKAVEHNHQIEQPKLLRSLAEAYLVAGFPEKGNLFNHNALMLDGDSARYFSYQATYEADNQGNYINAIDLLKNVYRIDSAFYGLNRRFALYYMYSKQRGESLKWVRRWVKELNTFKDFTDINEFHRIGYIYWVNGYKKEAEYYFGLKKQMIDETMKNSDGLNYYIYYDLAGMSAFRGNREQAFGYLRKFINRPHQEAWMVTLIKNDPLFETIRSEPEFQQIIRDVEAKFIAEHKEVGKWLEEQGML